MDYKKQSEENAKILTHRRLRDGLRGPLSTQDRQFICNHDFIPNGHGTDKCCKCGKIIGDNGDD